MQRHVSFLKYLFSELSSAYLWLNVFRLITFRVFIDQNHRSEKKEKKKAAKKAVEDESEDYVDDSPYGKQERLMRAIRHHKVDATVVR